MGTVEFFLKTKHDQARSKKKAAVSTVSHTHAKARPGRPSPSQGSTPAAYPGYIQAYLERIGSSDRRCTGFDVIVVAFPLS